MTTLFDPVKIGDIPLSNRIVMAPLTRNRAIEGNVPVRSRSSTTASVQTPV